MSLKVFHILFIAVSTALMVTFAAWALREYLHSRDRGDLTLGVIAIAAGLTLIIYGRWFLKKIQKTRLA